MTRPLMMTALVTGGRMPASLAMCRALKRSGATVIGTDSLDTTPLSGSNAVDLYVKTPPPSKSPEEFLAALSQIIKEHNVSHLIPMYEEGYVVSASLPQLASAHASTLILVDTVETLSILDDKWRFIAHCKSLGLPVPNTAVVTSVAQLRDQITRLASGIVVKPVFSRFAQGVFIDPSPEDLTQIHPSVDSPWVVQERVIGPVASSYGICRNGKILVHGDYGNDFVVGAKSKQGLGASSSYQPTVLPGSLEFAETLFGSLGYSGQYGLDYIVNDRGISCIECNPRATSGVHLFERDLSFGDIILGKPTMNQPRPSASSNHPQLLQCLISGEASIADPKLIKALMSPDVLFRFRDPMPVFTFRTMLKDITLQARSQQRPVADLFFEDLACEPR